MSVSKLNWLNCIGLMLFFLLGCKSQHVQKQINLSLSLRESELHLLEQDKLLVVQFNNFTNIDYAVVTAAQINRVANRYDKQLANEGILQPDFRLEVKFRGSCMISDTTIGWKEAMRHDLPVFLRISQGESKKIALWPTGDLRKIFSIPNRTPYNVRVIFMPNRVEKINLDEVYMYASDTLRAGERILSDTLYSPWITIQ